MNASNFWFTSDSNLPYSLITSSTDSLSEETKFECVKSEWPCSEFAISPNSDNFAMNSKNVSSIFSVGSISFLPFTSYNFYLF